jgi:hypothetical protein
MRLTYHEGVIPPTLSFNLVLEDHKFRLLEELQSVQEDYCQRQ